MAKRFHLVGLGCPKNQVDSEVIWAGLASAGLVATDDPAEAEIIVVNTCAFIQSAVEESLDQIVDLARYRKSGQLTKLVVTGCLPARYREKLADELSEVDLFVGPGEVDKLGAMLTGTAPSDRLVAEPGTAFLPNAKTPRVNSLSPGAAYVKVAEGCSRSCTFCIIPKLRGAQRSRPLDDLVAEVEALVHLGINEVVLVAQDLAAWGRDLPGKPGLTELVDALGSVGGLWWLRLMYLFPTQLPEGLLEVIAEREPVLPYLDIPLQHIDDRVLTRMRRGHTAAEARALISAIRKRLPNAVLRTSLMTGFPGEDQEAFDRLRDFVTETRFERLGVFAYSPEEGTVAAEMDDAPATELAHARREELLSIQQPIAEAYHRSLVNTTCEVLIEGICEDGLFEGRAWNQAPEVDGACFVEGHAALGEMVRVRLTDADVYDLQGEIIG